MLGLSTNDIGFALKVAFNGLKVSTYREGDEDYDITVQLSEEDRKKTDILRELMITTPTGACALKHHRQIYGHRRTGAGDPYRS